MNNSDFARGQAAERNRIAAIVLAPDALGKEGLAIELALNTNMGADEAILTLRINEPLAAPFCAPRILPSKFQKRTKA